MSVRRNVLIATVGPAVALASSVATAKPPDHSPKHVNQLLPTLTMAGSSSGKADLSAGLSVYWKLARDLDLKFAPAFTLTTNSGIGQLFNISGDNVSMGSPWKIVVNGALQWLDLNQTPPTVYKTELSKAGETCTRIWTKQQAELSEKIYAAHAQMAQNRERMAPLEKQLESLQKEIKSATDNEVRKRLQAQHEQLKQERRDAEVAITSADLIEREALLKKKAVDDAAKRLQDRIEKLSVPTQDDLCSEGIAEYNLLVMREPGHNIARDRLSSVPRLAIALGFSLGQVSFKYLESQPAAPMVLQDAQSSQVVSAGAASLTYINGRRGITFELPLSYLSAWDAATTTARVCTTLGMVGSDAAQSCRDSVVGAPSKVGTLQLSALVGYTDLRQLFWRGALGPYLSYRATGASEGRVELGLKAPVYLNFVAGIKGYKGEYHGMIRLTPSISWIKDSSGWQDVTFVIQAAVLGNRSMFPQAMEWLQQ